MKFFFACGGPPVIRLAIECHEESLLDKYLVHEDYSANQDHISYNNEASGRNVKVWL